jgi:hypothetical protein
MKFSNALRVLPGNKKQCGTACKLRGLLAVLLGGGGVLSRGRDGAYTLRPFDRVTGLSVPIVNPIPSGGSTIISGNSAGSNHTGKDGVLGLI